MLEQVLLLYLTPGCVNMPFIAIQELIVALWETWAVVLVLKLISLSAFVVIICDEQLFSK